MAKKISAIPNIDKNLGILDNLRRQLNSSKRLFGDENQYLVNLIDVLKKFRSLDLEISDETSSAISNFIKNIARYQINYKTKEDKESKIFGYEPTDKVVSLILEDLLISDVENYYASLPNDAQRKAQRKNVESMLGPISYNLVGHFKEMAVISVQLHDERVDGDKSIPVEAEKDNFVIPCAVDVPRSGGRIDRVNIVSPYLPVKERQVIDAIAARAIHANFFDGSKIYNTNIKPYITKVYSKVHRIDPPYMNSDKRDEFYKMFKDYWGAFDPKKDSFSTLEKRAKYDEAMKYNMSYFDFFAMNGEKTLPLDNTSTDIAEKCTTRLAGVKTYEEFKNSATYRCDQLLPAKERVFDSEEKYLRYVNSDLFVQEIQRKECNTKPVRALIQLGLYRPEKVLNASDKAYKKLQDKYVKKYGGKFVNDASGNRENDIYVGDGGFKSSVEVLTIEKNSLTDDQYEKLKRSYVKTYGGVFINDPSGDRFKDLYVELDVQMYYREPKELEKRFWDLSVMSKGFEPVKVRVGDKEKVLYNPVSYDIADREANPKVVRALALVGAVAILLPYGAAVGEMVKDTFSGLFPAGGDETTGGSETTTPSEDVTVSVETTSPNVPDSEVTTGTGEGNNNPAISGDDTTNNWGPDTSYEDVEPGTRDNNTEGFEGPDHNPAETTRRPAETTKTPETTRRPAETTKTPETTKRPAETTRTPETTKTPETTNRNPAIGGADTNFNPETTRTPETTRVPETTKAPGNKVPVTPGKNPSRGDSETTGPDTSYENVEPGNRDEQTEGGFGKDPWGFLGIKKKEEDDDNNNQSTL